MKDLLLLGLLLSLGACASNDYYQRFDAVGPGGNPGREARYSLRDPHDHEDAAILVRASGRSRVKLDKAVSDTVRVLFYVQNGVQKPLQVLPESLTAHDDTGHVFRLLETVPPPKEHPEAPFEALFDVGSADAFPAIGSITVHWAYQFGEGTVTHETRFLPVRSVRHSYYGHGGYPYGYGYGYGYYGGGYYCY